MNTPDQGVLFQCVVLTCFLVYHTVNSQSACGGTLTSLTGIIHSPNFPNNYNNGLGCVYVISVPDTYHVTLTFTNFDVENTTNCRYDYVEVRDGDNVSSHRFGRYCGTSLPGPLRTSGNRMWIKFVTGSIVTRPGFRANYTSACGATLTSLTGLIQSPNFPNNYPNGLGCVYVISVPDAYRVTLTFTNFDVENSTDCKYDYVEVRDGDSESSPRFGRYCGTSLPGPLRTSSNRMWIKFVTGSIVTRPGFRANYTSGTGHSAPNGPLIGGVAAGVSVVVVVVVIIVVFALMKRRDPQHGKPGKRKNRTSKEPHSDPRTENNQPELNNITCSVSSISARPPGDTLYCKQEKKKKHPEESPYIDLSAPYEQAAITYQAFDENVDPDYVYSIPADENGGYDSSSVHANLESEPDDDYLQPVLTNPPTPPRKPPTIPPR